MGYCEKMEEKLMFSSGIITVDLPFACFSEILNHGGFAAYQSACFKSRTLMLSLKCELKHSIPKIEVND